MGCQQMSLLPIGMTVCSLQCISLIGFHPLFFIIKPLLSCFVVRSLIIILLRCLVVYVLHPHWLITSLNLILEPPNVFSWVILLLLKGYKLLDLHSKRICPYTYLMTLLMMLLYNLILFLQPYLLLLFPLLESLLGCLNLLHISNLISAIQFLLGISFLILFLLNICHLAILSSAIVFLPLRNLNSIIKLLVILTGKLLWHLKLMHWNKIIHGLWFLCHQL